MLPGALSTFGPSSSDRSKFPTTTPTLCVIVGHHNNAYTPIFYEHFMNSLYTFYRWSRGMEVSVGQERRGQSRVFSAIGGVTTRAVYYRTTDISYSLWLIALSAVEELSIGRLRTAALILWVP
jgi:hypothetical protein